MRHGYGELLQHFNKLAKMNSWGPNMVAPIRESYKLMFEPNPKSSAFNIFDLSITRISAPFNPIGSITTAIGPQDDADDIHTGIVPDGVNVYTYLHVIPIEMINGGIRTEDEEEYLKMVYEVMLSIISCDRFFNLELRGNPHVLFLHLLPIYLTFKHAKECGMNPLTKQVFHDIIERDIDIDPEDIPKIINSMNLNYNYNDEEDIYRTMITRNGIII